MSKRSCEAAESAEGAVLRMARAECPGLTRSQASQRRAPKARFREYYIRIEHTSADHVPLSRQAEIIEL